MTNTNESIFRQLLRLGQYPALDAHLRLHRAANNSDDIIVWSTLCAQAQGDLHAAYRFIQPLAARSPRKAEIQALLGKVADELQTPNLRLQAWQAAVNADPSNMKYRIRLAKYHADMGNATFGREVIEILQRTNHSIKNSAIDAPTDWPEPKRLEEDAVVVLAPVYDDLEVTQKCLQALTASLDAIEAKVHILVINDASPSEQLTQWLQKYCPEHSVELQENKQNRGFIHTVNAGLARYPQHDIVLLNADTLVHGNWLDRLHSAAHSEDGIASVTPLSNFGELVSFPRPMFDNPLVDFAQVEKIDTLAATTNQLATVEIPTGVGFCMYLRKEAIQEVGLLDTEHYQRGYGEEVDWCLRFTEAGYKNLCAPNVYVGHRGTTSFKAEKPILAARNNKTLERRYPQYEAAYDTFLFRDPLAPHRRAIETELLRHHPDNARLIMAQPDNATTQQQRMHAAAQGKRLLIGYRDYSQPGEKWRLLVDDALAVSSLQFDQRSELEALVKQVSGIESSHASEPVFKPVPAPRSATQVVLVNKGPHPIKEYPQLAAVAKHIATEQLPIQLWLQYATLNDGALTALGCVSTGNEWQAIDKRDHEYAGGCTIHWQPDINARYDSAKEIESTINGWY